MSLTLSNLLVELGYKKPLTVDDIIETIDTYREAHNGELPVKTSGVISEGSLANGSRTWVSIDLSLALGRNGLKNDSKWQAMNDKVGEGHHLTLPAFLVELGYKDAPLQLTIDTVVDTVEAYRAAHDGKTPNDKSGEIAEGPLAGKMKWPSLSAAVRDGKNGLKEDPKWQEINQRVGNGNFTLFSLLIELGYKDAPVNLTIDLIAETIEAYRAAHNGKNPTIDRDNITKGPLAKQTTWETLSKNLQNGQRGLQDDPKWQVLNDKVGNENLTLARLLIELGFKAAPVDLTIDLIAETIEAYRAAHDGKNPTPKSGDIIEEGPLANGKRTWVAVSGNLASGQVGLEDDPKWQALNDKVGNENLTLAKLLIELGYKNAPVNLTIDLIVETIEAYRAAHDGKNPTVDRGDITEGPLENSKKTWSSLNGAIQNGHLGLKDDPKWQVLNDKVGNENLTLARLLIELGFKAAPVDLTIDLIAETIEAYRAAHDGKNPTLKSGDIEERPLSGQTTWGALSKNLQNGHRGLEDDPKWVTLNDEVNGNLSLPILINKLGYRFGITINLIVETVDAYRALHDGKNPTTETGQIKQGPLANQISWAALSGAISQGIHNLGKDSKWRALNEKVGDGKLSLHTLLIELGYKDAPVDLTIDLIVETIEAYRAVHDGKNPTVDRGDITEGPLADGKRSWSSVDAALSKGGNGLPEDPKWQALNEKYKGKFSLAKLKKEYPHIPRASSSQNSLPAPGEP